MAFWRKRSGDGAKPVSFDLARADFARLTGVSLALGGKQVLNDVSLTLREARIGIIGLNGSGKSSFLRLLNGLRLPDTGSVELFGADTRKAQPELPRHVGFVFQNPDHQAIFPTVEEEIAFGLTQLGRDKHQARQEALAFLAKNNCSDLAERPIAELSEGQKQLIAILSTLVMNPEVLVLDEPMASLDRLATRIIFARLMALPQKIVMVSHDLDLLREFDRVIWLESGQVRADGPPGPVLESYLQDVDRRAGTVPSDGAAL